MQTISSIGPTFSVIGSLQVGNTTISEPTSFALLGLGSLGLGLAGHKKA